MSTFLLKRPRWADQLLPNINLRPRLLGGEIVMVGTGRAGHWCAVRSGRHGLEFMRGVNAWPKQSLGPWQKATMHDLCQARLLVGAFVQERAAPYLVTGKEQDWASEARRMTGFQVWGSASGHDFGRHTLGEGGKIHLDLVESGFTLDRRYLSRMTVSGTPITMELRDDVYHVRMAWMTGRGTRRRGTNIQSALAAANVMAKTLGGWAK